MECELEPINRFAVVCGQESELEQHVFLPCGFVILVGLCKTLRVSITN